MTKIITTTPIQMKTGKRQFPITLGLSEIIDRKEIMKNVDAELKEKENIKPELTLLQRNELNKQFIESSKNGNLEKVKELLNKGVDVNSQNNFGKTALMLASEHGNTEIVDLLLNDPRTKINEKDKSGWTALIYASWKGKKEIVNLLLNDLRTEINEKDNKGMTALMYASKDGNTEIVNLLLNDLQIEINIQDFDGNTAFMYSIDKVLTYPSTERHNEIFKLLIEKDVNVNLKGDRNNTALDILFNKWNSDPNTMYYIKNNNNLYNNLKLVFEKSNCVPLELHKKLLTSLHYENEYPYVVDLIKISIQKGANINLCIEGFETTALIEAVKANDINFTKFLLDHKANIDIKDSNGKKAVEHVRSGAIYSLFIDRDLIEVKWIDLLCFANLTTLVKYYYKKFKRISK